MASKAENISCRVRYLGIAEHINVGRVTVEEQRVAPALLILGHEMDIGLKEEDLICAVIPSLVCREHVVILPHISRKSECRKVPVGLIHQRTGLDEDRISEHVHIGLKSKDLDL